MSQLPDVVIKRIDRAGGTQERHGRCLICLQPWDDCPHNRIQIDVLLAAYWQDKSLAAVLKEIR